MRLQMIVWMAMRSMNARRTSSALLIGVIALLTAITLTMGSICFGWQNYAFRRVAAEGPNHIRVWAGQPPAGKIGRLLRLSDMEYVQQACPLVTGVCALDAIYQATLLYRDRQYVSWVFGFTPNYVQVRAVPISRGRSFTEEENRRRAPVIVLGPLVAVALFGDEPPLGKRITVKAEHGGHATLLVIGVADPVAFTLMKKSSYVPISVTQSGLSYRNQGHGEVESLSAATARLEDTPAGLAQIREALAKRNVYLDPNSYAGLDLYQTAAQEPRRGTIIILVLGCGALLTTGLGLAKLMLSEVASRRQEIGLRKALGAPPRAIRGQFLAESVFMGGVGALIGLALGAVLIYLHRDPYSVGWMVQLGLQDAPVVPAGLPVGLLLYMAVVAGLAGLVPARRAGRLDPIDALRGR